MQAETTMPTAKDAQQHKTKQSQSQAPAKGAGRPSIARSRYAHALDGLRAICALGVLFYHMDLRWMSGGFHGVTVLFVLAGYLATSGLVREFRRNRGSIDLVGYWLRRLRRLMPTVIVFLFVTAALCSLFNHVMLTKMRPDIVPATFMYLNWAKIFRAEDYFAQAGSPSPLTHFWTLAIEWQFYLVLPPVLLLLLKRRVPVKALKIGFSALAVASAVLMAALYLGGGGATRAYYGTDTRAMSLLLGCAFAFVFPFDAIVGRKSARLKPLHRNLAGPIGTVSLVALLAIMVLTNGYSGFTYLGGTLLVSLLSIAVIAACVPSDTPLSRILSLPPLTWIGERSYALYVWHYPIIELLTRRNAAVATPLWRYALMVGISIAAAAISYQLVEQPLRKRTLKEAVGHASDVAWKDVATLTSGSVLDRIRVGAQAAGVLLFLVACVGGVTGLATIPAVNALGDKAGEPRVSKATLRKPLVDGVYDVVFIGDSVSLGANEQLNAAFPHGIVNSEGSRQADAALEVFQAYEDEGVVGDMVVMHVGTNGVLEDDIMEQIVEAVGPERDLWLVNDRTPDSRMEPNNACIQRCVDAHDNVHLIDWAAETEGHSEYLDDDGIHLTYAGRDAYGALVPRAMDYEPADAENTHYDVTLIGDATALSAVDELSARFPHGVVDCAEGRDPEKLVDTYQGYANQDIVGEDIVLCLGSDEPISRSALVSLLDTIGPERTIWLVNVRTTADWCEKTNQILAEVAQSRPHVTVVDWYGASEGKEDWFEDGNMLLTGKGAEAYADAIATAMDYDARAEAAKKEKEEAAASEGEGEDSGEGETYTDEGDYSDWDDTGEYSEDLGY